MIDAKKTTMSRPGRKWGWLTCAVGLVLFAAATPRSSPAGEASHPEPNAVGPDCDRRCLTGILDQYLSGLVEHDPARVPFAASVKFTENNVPLRIGDGLWGTVSGLRHEADLEFADPERGQVGFYGVVEEHGIAAYLALRLRIREHRIAEVETIVHRKEAGPGADPLTFRQDPGFLETIPPEQRTPRARMIDLAYGYFSTLQLNDGKIFTQFDDSCARWENGGQSAGNPNAATPNGKMPCGEQFKLGNYRWDTRVRDRDFPLVDEERGLVMTRAFIDHAGILTDYTLTNGEKRTSNIKAPHTWCMLEVFRIKDGKIFRVQAVFIAVPYYSRSPWAHYDD
jgi:hypothetical protein